MKLNCVVVDDEDLAVNLLRHFILQSPDLKLLKSFTSSPDALTFINRNKPELLFLDIQMPGMTGMELIGKLSYKPIVLLITAYADFAQKAFDLDVADYLLKPYTKSRFEKSLEKVLAYHEYAYGKRNSAKRNVLYAKYKGILEKIKPEDVLFIQGMKQYLKIVTGTKNYLVLDSFKSMEEKLPQGIFKRVHKSYLVNSKWINEIRYDSVSVEGHSIPVGRLYRKNVSN